MLSVRTSSWDARGKFGEQERGVRVARGDTREQLQLLECSPNFPSASITQNTHSKKQFFQNMTTTTRALEYVLFLIDYIQFLRCTVKENNGLYYFKAGFIRRTSHEPNGIQMRKTPCSPSLIGSLSRDVFEPQTSTGSLCSCFQQVFMPDQ